MAQPATADSPLVVISYHPSDELWAEKLFSRITSSAKGKYGIWMDRLDGDGRTRVGDMQRVALLTAKVVVILISPKYINTTWAASEEGHKVLAPGKRQDVLGLLVQNTPREHLSWLPSQYMGMNATPLAEATADDENAILTKVVRLTTTLVEDESASQVSQPDEDKQLPRIADVSRYAWTDEAEDALSRARRLATTTKPPVVTTAALLFGMAEGGRAKADYFRTPQFLWEELTGHDHELYNRALLEEFPALVNLGERAGRSIESIPREADLVSPNVLKICELAGEIGRRTTRPTTETQNVSNNPPQFHVGARHLLAALLILRPDDGPTGASRRLASIVGDVMALRRRFYNFIVRNLPDDDHEAWRPILINLKFPEAPSPRPQEPEPQPKESQPQPTVAGFMADEWTGRDLLGITQDVNALASLVAAYKVEPPLSIGLFGDWGSGKSHFMRQMKRRVEMLSRHARESGQPQRKLGYYKNIVQIEFNAWHYIEGNLWASLVDHIFANLKLSEREPPKYAEQRRDELMQKLGLKEEIKKKIDSQVEACQQELRKVEERKEQAEAALNNASTQLEDFRQQAKASLETLTVTVELSPEEKELLNRLGIDPRANINGAEVRRDYDELKGRWNRLKAQWLLFRGDKRVGRRYLLSSLLVLIVFGGPLLLKLGTLPRVPTLIVTVLGFIATFVAAAKPAWDQLRKTLNALEKREQEVERECLRRVTELESKVNALGGEVVAAKLKSETVGKEIGQLKEDIASTSSSRLLAEFIEDRAAASDYRRHLGLLALIRRDFEKLRDLFEQQRKEEHEGTETTDQTKINRIVLYIDDLDRCSPDRVVQVLQAIHLLLAFPLFVVVVGVDSRWVTRSLQQSYEWLRETAGLDGQETATDHEEKSPAVGGATPHDYLEKIFQIPFWLRSMNEVACAEFLDGLTRDVTSFELEVVEPEMSEPDQPSGNVEKAEPQHATAAQSPERIAGPYLTTATATPRFTPSNVSLISTESATKEYDDEVRPDLAPRSLTFSTYEIDYMKKLVPLIGRSPRAVKRFLNCYRLIKVSLTPAEFESFVGENGDSQGYKAAMILLGVITGTPAVSTYVIDHLKTWRAATPETTVAAWATRFTLDPEVQRQPDVDRLSRFFENHDFGPLSTSELLIVEMVNWAPRVSRFSFRLNRPDPLRR